MVKKRTWRNPVLFQEELKNRLPSGEQLRRIIEEPQSEDLLTWNVFATLKRSKPTSRWLTPFLQRSLTNLTDSIVQDFLRPEQLDNAVIELWLGKRRAPTYPPPQERESWLREYLGNRGGGLFQRWSTKPGKVEGTTEVDLTIETEKAFIFIEAKYLSDISPHVSYDPWRDQIVRTIDVGTYQAQLAEPKREFFFTLLTPRWDNEYEERSWLYWYKMRDYREHPELLRAKLPHRDPTLNLDCKYPIDFETMARRIGWTYWPDIISLADREVKAGHVPDVSAQEWRRVMKDFQYKGLI